MTFEIDTGIAPNDLRNAYRFNYCQDLRDAVMDHLPDGASEEEISIGIAKSLIAMIWKPKKPETVRRHLARYMPLILEMAETAPDSFDKVFAEYTERASEFR